MEEITNNEQFMKALEHVYCEKGNRSQFQELFDKLAKYMLCHIEIKAGGAVYSLAEIEFYYRNQESTLLEEDESFKRTYPRNRNAADFFWHYSGIDICFATSKNQMQFGGILIRSLIKDGSTLIAGPLRCANELMNQCSENGGKMLPQIKGNNIGKRISITATIRQGIETGDKFYSSRKAFKKDNKIDPEILPLFCYYINEADWSTVNYSANPLNVDMKKNGKEIVGRADYVKNLINL